MSNTLGVGPSFGSCAPGTTFDITLTGTTAGRGVVVLICWEDNGPATTISTVTVGGQSATIVAGSLAQGTAIDYTQLALLNNLTSGGNKTVTVTMSGSAYATGVAVEVAGLDTTAAADASLSITGTTSTPITGTITTATANASIFAVTTAAGDSTAGPNYTLLSNPRTNNGYNDEDEYWLDAGAAGAKTVSFDSLDSGGIWMLSAISVKTATTAYDAATFQAMLAQTQGGAAMIGRACRGVYG
jgi:hypothetical protein